MRKVPHGQDDLLLELTRRELETLYMCVVEALEALPPAEFAIRVGVESDVAARMIDDLRSALGWRSIAQLHVEIDPLMG